MSKLLILFVALVVLYYVLLFAWVPAGIAMIRKKYRRRYVILFVGTIALAVCTLITKWSLGWYFQGASYPSATFLSPSRRYEAVWTYANPTHDPPNWSLQVWPTLRPSYSLSLYRIEMPFRRLATPEFDGRNAAVYWSESEDVVVIAPTVGRPLIFQFEPFTDIGHMTLVDGRGQTVLGTFEGRRNNWKHLRRIELKPGYGLSTAVVEKFLERPPGSIGQFPAQPTPLPSSIDEAREWIEADDRPACYAAVEYLAEHKSAADIVDACSHETPEMRTWAAQCAQRFDINSAEMLSALAKLLYDEELAVKASAWAALKHLTTNNVLLRSVEDWQEYRLDK